MNKIKMISKNLIAWIKNHKLITGGVVIVVLVVVGLIMAFSGNGDSEVVQPLKRDLVETVKISGRVEADIVSDLGFSASGRAESVVVKVNDKVFTGQRLASLSLGTLPAELRSAEADVLIKQAELKNKTVNLDTITQKQDHLKNWFFLMQSLQKPMRSSHIPLQARQVQQHSQI